MNYLGINCTVDNGLGKIYVVIVKEKNEVITHMFRSPSVFSFKKNSAEILNWHRDNIISLISQYNIEGIVVKKTERTAFFSKPKNSDIFKMYMEGVMLSLAGSIGKFNKHWYKAEIQSLIPLNNVFEKDFDTICGKFEIQCDFDGLRKGDIQPFKETLLAVLALREKVSK